MAEIDMRCGRCGRSLNFFCNCQPLTAGEKASALGPVLDQLEQIFKYFGWLPQNAVGRQWQQRDPETLKSMAFDLYKVYLPYTAKTKKIPTINNGFSTFERTGDGFERALYVTFRNNDASFEKIAVQIPSIETSNEGVPKDPGACSDCSTEVGLATPTSETSMANAMYTINLAPQGQDRVHQQDEVATALLSALFDKSSASTAAQLASSENTARVTNEPQLTPTTDLPMKSKPTSEDLRSRFVPALKMTTLEPFQIDEFIKNIQYVYKDHLDTLNLFVQEILLISVIMGS